MVPRDLVTDAVDVLIVGGGPGGYTAALRAAGHGLRTTLVEGMAIGGTCLNVGCIPSKAIIHVADRFGQIGASSDLEALGIGSTRSLDFGATQQWKSGVVSTLRDGVAGQLQRAGVTVVQGWARVVDGKTVHIEGADLSERTIRCLNLVIASGSRPMELPSVPFGDSVLSSSGVLSLSEVPTRLAVVGAGYIGLELGTAFAKLGAAVTIVEAARSILPMYDSALVRPIVNRLSELGVDVRLATSATGAVAGGLTIAAFDDRSATEVVAADVILVAVGREPVLDGWGLDSLDLAMSGRFLAIDDHCRTSMRGVYAVGDVTGEPMLAHRAMAQATLVADVIAGQDRVWDHVAVPAVCFTDPELLAVGLAPHEARAAGIEVVIGIEPFKANGRALTLDRDDGFVRIVADASNGQIVGIQAVGVGVSELSSAAAGALELGATIGDLELTMHAHPTMAESIHGAIAAAALARARR